MTKFCLEVDETKSNSDGTKDAKITVEGSTIDLVNLLACACDKKEVREIIKMAMALDIAHEKIVGRRFDENL